MYPVELSFESELECDAFLCIIFDEGQDMDFYIL